MEEKVRWKDLTDKQWKAALKHLLQTNDKAVYRAIIRIYERQTLDERNLAQTTEHNGRGFGSVDAQLMTRLALKIQERQTLTPGEMAAARNKMLKYWKQLREVSEHDLNRK